MLTSRPMQATMDDRETAFTLLLDRGLDAHFRLAAVILGDATEAEDAVHDAALVAWRGFAHLRDHDRFDAWFGRILVNGCRDRLRTRRRRPILVPIHVRDDAHGPPDAASLDPSLRVDAHDALERAFVRLDPDHAIVIVLRYYLDLQVSSIAERLGIAEGTVKSRLHHGLRRLRTAMEQAEGDHHG